MSGIRRAVSRMRSDPGIDSQNYLMSFLIIKYFVVSGVGISDPPAKRETPRRIPYNHFLLHIISVASLRRIAAGSDRYSQLNIHRIDTVIQTKIFLTLMHPDVELRQVHNSLCQLPRLLGQQKDSQIVLVFQSGCRGFSLPVRRRRKSPDILNGKLPGLC